MTGTKRFRWTLVAAAVACALTGGAFAAGLQGPATIVYDQYRVPTIVATNEHDAIFLQGYLHAKNRFFQMDFQRRLFSGRVSEIVGQPGLPQDIQLRTLGLRRAAERSLLVQTPEAMAWLQAYADGVNAWLNDTTNALPIEFGAVEITRAGIDQWTPLDSLTMAKGLAFGLSFDLGDTNRTLALLNYRGVCTLVGCNGLQLYNDDLWRVAPFESAVSIPSPPLFTPEQTPSAPATEELPSYLADADFRTLVESYQAEISAIPILNQALNRDSGEVGSNWWVVAGANTDSGYPMLASDPHLSLGTPATFYEVHLNVTGGINVTGVSFPGTPGVVIGCNDTICWGATVNSQDVTDVFNEVLVPHPQSPTTPIGIRFEGNTEPLVPIPQTFFINVVGDGVLNTKINANIPATSGGVTLTVPRRNNGPIVQTTFNASSPTPLTGLSVAYTGWSGTHEVETLRRFARAASMADFKDALQYFDVGSQNWSYADINGNIAYYTSGELPLRQDLQTLLFPAGLVHPGIIRDGTNTNKHQWLPLAGPPQPNQALSTQILPFAEMPQIENPPEGYIINANNDPGGTTLDNVTWNQFRAGFNGVLYLSAGYASGERLGRIQRLFESVLTGAGTMSLNESIAIQANNQILDAEILTPYLFTAYANATAAGAPPELAAIVADPRIGDAIARLSSWDFSTPTGIQQGFDPGDNPLALPAPSPAEINASVATTIYSTWRGQVVQRVIDQTLATLPTLSNFPPGSDQAMSALRRFLDTYDINGGVGASLVNFFRVPGVVDQAVARDIILLQSLQNGLNLLASNTFAAAFSNSTNLDDYRWGKLHRIVFTHFLGGPFNMPPPGHPLNVGPGLNGIARAGGRQAVDASSHDARADGLNEFMFSSGPARRIQAIMQPGCPQILEVIPGGENGAPGGANSTDQLFLWLVNAYKELPICLSEVQENAVETVQISCGNSVRDPGEACDDGNAVETDGCTSSCNLAPIVNCLSPTASAGADVCSASISCAAVATCADPAGGTATSSCDPGSPYGLGTTSVTVQCSGPSGTTTATCSATVIDDTPPTISVTTDPAFLWPPNHRMADVDATVTVTDNCDEALAIVLVSATSSEPDDVTGAGDGHTIPDIDGATTGTADFEVQLRAERQAQGGGRTYTLTYSASDDSGNSSSASATVQVPQSLAGSVEPLNLTLSRGSSTRVEWGEVPGAVHYDIIRGDLAALRIEGSNVNMGSVSCIETHSLDTTTTGFEDNDIPAPGQVFFYAVQFNDGRDNSSYGSVGVGRARVVSGGDCQ